jgi:hypothetical protein
MKLTPQPVPSNLRAKRAPPYLSIFSQKSRAKRRAVNTFRINTCESVSKQRTLSTFKMNTCEKQGGGGRYC